MYAIIAECGRQYRVEEGQEVYIDYREEVEPGQSIKFEHVLLVSGGEGVRLGEPTVAGASVTAEVVGPKLGVKVVIQKFRRRKNYRRRKGHRQMHTLVKISKISG